MVRAMTESVENAAPKGRPLVRKIASIMAEISRVPKRGRHSGLRYDYVQEADLMDLLRDRMADQGVVIFPSVREHRMVESRDDRGRVQFLTTVTMEITLIDSESGDQLTTSWIGQGMDAGDKGYYKAYTGAIKYFLLKTFLISTGDEATTPMPAPHERRERPQEAYIPPPPHHEPPHHDEAPPEPAADPEPPLDEYPHPEDEDAAPAAPAEEPAPEEPIEEPAAAPEPAEEPAHVEEPAVEAAAEPAADVEPEPAPPVEEPVEEPAPVEAPAAEEPPADEPEPVREAPAPEPITAQQADEAAPVGFSEDPLWQDIFEQVRGQLKGLKGPQRERFLATLASNRGLSHTTELSPEQLMEELELLESLEGDARKAHLKDPAAATRPDSLADQFMTAAQDAVPSPMVVGLRRLYLDKMGAALLTEVDEAKLGAMVKKLNKMSGQERAEYIAQVLSSSK
jgi:hypothetical protein